MTTPTVRAAGVHDVTAIAALEAVAFPADPWSPVLVAEGVAGRMPTATFLVAEVDGVFVGHAVVSVVAEVAELQRIAVVDTNRRSGVATALLEASRATAREGGAERLLLEVREDNAPAHAFYERQGFTEIARRAGYYRDGVTAVVLERVLV
ncbi:MAG TPA: ribosomal protein S18-alanine N-acetyltransferase [Nocardioides sp.]|nr:ribosomal protein S18-alanine N-acetyltransferase [Nocardioides sp.]